MKFTLFFMCLVYTLSLNSVWATCLDTNDKTQAIEAKIRGFYSRSAPDYQFVIFDKASCSIRGNKDIEIGKLTKESGFLKVKNEDKFIQSSLLMAYAQGSKVLFRLEASDSDGYNNIQYIVFPFDARN